MYSLVPSRPTGYLIRYNLLTTISELSDLYTNSILLTSDLYTSSPTFEIFEKYEIIEE